MSNFKLSALTQNVENDDILIHLSYCSSLLLHKKISRHFLAFSICFIFLELFSCSYSLFSNMNKEFWLRYSMLALESTSFPILFYVIAFLKKDEYYLAIALFKDFWSFDSLGRANYERLCGEAKIAKYFLGMLIFLGVVQMVICVPWSGNESDIFLQVKLITDCFNEWAWPFLIIFYVVFMHRYCVILGLLFALAYMVLHLKFQCFLLNKRLEQIGELSTVLKLDKTITQQKHQNMIKRELTICVKLHQTLLLFGNRINNIIYHGSYFLTAYGVIIFVIIIFSAKTQAHLWAKFPLVPPLCILMTGAFVLMGQLLEDESRNLFTSASSLPWYIWDDNNKKMILYFLCRTQKVINLSCSGIVIVNYRLLIVICRNIYSFVTILLHLDMY